ncbi:MAG: UDP-2,4-diacetamido-2,4,6-trideoxy-beta-L-altropyranose hydrolase [Rhodospirillales bacterium]|nr:UDP-2,4-diacetamido-2,4,6-trideoxy-beta-L-altropyranose hydrolase [Rhodospirillales bacterium]
MSIRGRAVPPLAVVRCDASADLGGGHLARCSALAAALKRRGWRVSLAIHADSNAASHSAGANFQHIIRLEAGDEAAAIGAALGERAELVVVDHYHRGRSFQTACRAWADRVLVLSDVPDRHHDADILLDDAFGRAAEDYRRLVSPACQVLTGSRFALLDPAFAAARPAAIARRGEHRPVSRLLVAMGAADIDNVTAMVLDAVAVSRLSCAVDVVLGDDAPHKAEVAERLAALSQPARLHVGVGVRSMVDLTTDADLAVGAGGTMSWERCCLGLPTILITTGANQEVHAANLAAAGAVWLSGSHADVSAGSIRDDLLAIAADAAARRRLSASAAAVCDGRGADRVSAVIDETVRGIAPHPQFCSGDA